MIELLCFPKLSGEAGVCAWERLFQVSSAPGIQKRALGVGPRTGLDKPSLFLLIIWIPCRPKKQPVGAAVFVRCAQ